MLSFNHNQLSRRTVLRGFAASLALPFLAGTSRQGFAQLDPDDRSYVLNLFTIERESMEVLVTRTASTPYLAGKEYWNTNQGMLHAIAHAKRGTSMSIFGTSHDWPAPHNFNHTFRMQDAVTWGTTPAPSGLVWVYSDPRSNAYVCIEFLIAKSRGHMSITSINWYLASTRAPQAKTFVFPYGTTYTLKLGSAPTLPTGYSWYGVAVHPGS